MQVIQLFIIGRKQKNRVCDNSKNKTYYFYLMATSNMNQKLTSRNVYLMMYIDQKGAKA